MAGGKQLVDKGKAVHNKILIPQHSIKHALTEHTNHRI